MAVSGTDALSMADRQKSSIEYSLPKLDRNNKRDIEQTVLLQSGGWSVVRNWELFSLDKAVLGVSEGAS